MTIKEIDPRATAQIHQHYGLRPIRGVLADGTFHLGPAELFDSNDKPPLTEAQMETAKNFCAGLLELGDPQKLLPLYKKGLEEILKRGRENPALYRDNYGKLNMRHVQVDAWRSAANRVAKNHGETQGIDPAILTEISEGINLIAGCLSDPHGEAALKTPETFLSYPHPTTNRSNNGNVPKAVVKCPDWAIETSQRWFPVAEQVFKLVAPPEGN